MTRTGSVAAILIVAAVASAGWWLFKPNNEQAVRTTSAPEAATGGAMVQVRLPASFSTEEQIGQRGFDENCAACHGANAAGQAGIAPPLVHKIYEPSHHGDMAFVLAAQNGVRAHHWQFGNMPPVEGILPADVSYITAYVRALQRANGIN